MSSEAEKVLTVRERVALAARAKVKVKASARGWSMLSKDEIVSLAFVVDFFLEDGEIEGAGEAPAPPVIYSEL